MPDSSKQTVLSRPNPANPNDPWPRWQADKLTINLRADVSCYPDHPKSLVLAGGYTREEVETALGSTDFEYRLVNNGDRLFD